MSKKIPVYDAMGSEYLDHLESQGVKINRELLDEMGSEAYPFLYEDDVHAPLEVQRAAYQFVLKGR